MIFPLSVALYIAGQGVSVGPESGLGKTTKCYLAESKRLAFSALSEREIASRVVEICRDEIDFAASEMFPDNESLRLKLVVSVKDRVIAEVQTLRSPRKKLR